MQRISAQNNAINWFEIPILDIARAKRFYESVLGIQMEILSIEATKETLVLFPRVPTQISALSGRVTGALVKNDSSKPSQEGILIYLNASPLIQDAIDRVEPAGGKVLVPKTKIVAGHISVILDTEGNRVALHAEN